MDKKLDEFIIGLLNVVDYKKITKNNPRILTVENPINSTEVKVVCSVEEPGLLLLPMNGVWLCLDQTSNNFKKVFRITSELSTASSHSTWAPIHAYLELFELAQRNRYGMVSGEGPAGEPGPAGPQGMRGPQGERGSTGMTGPLGDTGPAGTPGYRGPEGPVGPSGLDGVNGADSTVIGPMGPRGFNGAKGDDGERGTKGENSTVLGPRGPQGIQGPTGPRGYPGDNGLQGITGTPGTQGQLGFPGMPGRDGRNGTDGIAQSAELLFYLDHRHTVSITNDQAISLISGAIPGVNAKSTNNYSAEFDQHQHDVLVTYLNGEFVFGAKGDHLHATLPTNKGNTGKNAQNIYDIHGFSNDVITSNQVLLGHVCARPIRLEINMQGSKAKAMISGSDIYVLSVQLNSIEIATITFNGSDAGNFEMVNQIDLIKGDVIEVVAPSIPNTNFEKIYVTVSATLLDNPS